SLTLDAVARRYQHRNIPIYPVGVSDPLPPKDLSVDNLEAPDVTIVGDKVSFDFVLKAQGYEQRREVDLEFLQDGNLLKREKVERGGDRPEVSKQIEWKFEKEGEFNVEVRIPPDEQEISVENNKAFHHIRVIAERIKVLY